MSSDGSPRADLGIPLVAPVVLLAVGSEPVLAAGSVGGIVTERGGRRAAAILTEPPVVARERNCL